MESNSLSKESHSSDSRQSSQLLSRIQSKVGNIYYKHGLICSRHPYLVIIITLLTVSVCCYPITGIRYLLGNSSQEYMTSVADQFKSNVNQNSQSDGENSSENKNHIPRWV